MSKSNSGGGGVHRLMELVVALLVLALFATTAAVGVAGVGAAAATEGAAWQLARELQAARQMAVTRQITVEVAFFRSQRCYLIKEERSDAPPARRIDLPPGVEWRNFPFESIRFHATGRVTRNGTIGLGHSQWPGQMRVVVAPGSGRIRVERQ